MDHRRAYRPTNGGSFCEHADARTLQKLTMLFSPACVLATDDRYSHPANVLDPWERSTKIASCPGWKSLEVMVRCLDGNLLL